MSNQPRSPIAHVGRTILASISLLVLVLLSGACGSGLQQNEAQPIPQSQPAAVQTPETTVASTTIEPTTATQLPAVPTEPAGTIVARPSGAVSVYSDATSTEASQVLPAATEFGSATALLVIEQSADRMKVLLPVRPNGSTGWIDSAGVETRSVALSLEVSLATRTLTLSDGDANILSTPIAVGSEQYPTPVGSFSVVDKLDTRNNGSAYGPFAIGLSAHSDVLTEFGGGDGQIGIHGTNDPSSIGQAVSHGCIRVPNDIVTQLNNLLPLGTPVTIS